MLAEVSLDLINTAAQVGQFVVVASTAVAAILQIRHLRATNELEALLTMTEQLREDGLRDAFRYVEAELAGHLEDRAYRRELVKLGFVDPEHHPEMDVCNWFNYVGALVKNGLIDRTTFLDLFSPIVTHYWARLEPAVALLRRERGPSMYENFEYLALLARAWKARHPEGAYPRGAARLAISDPWKDLDAADA
jgi:hydrogenase maturation factor